MSTEAIFTDDAYQRECEARVVAVGQDGIELDRTVFYPRGGGQPGDSGTFVGSTGREITIADTVYGEGGRIVHLAENGATLPEAGDVVRAVLDWERRYRHMRMHTCLHLLGTLLPYGVTGGNITSERSRLDFDMEEIPDKEQVESDLNRLIEDDHRVQTRWITDEELDARPELVRTMKVKPPRDAGKVRLLEIADIDLQPCGGTHLLRTGEVGRARISKIEKKGRHNRRVYIVLDE
ncbi:MAG: alanyl-tRNA editing protein [Pseudomonadales bacterium]